MENQYLNEEKQGNVLTGLIGALLGALVGAAAWAAVGILLNLITGIIGLVIGLLASKGYDLFKGRAGVSKLICVIIAIVFGVVVGTCAIYVVPLIPEYIQYTEALNMGSDGASAGSLLAGLRAVQPQSPIEFMQRHIEPYSSDLVKNMTIGLLFAAMGAFDVLKDIVAKPKAQPTNDVNSADVTGLDAANVPQQPTEEQTGDSAL